MKKISCFLLGVLVAVFAADADAKSLTSEIRSGLKSSSYGPAHTPRSTRTRRRAVNYTASNTVDAIVYESSDTIVNVDAGEMGREVFYDEKPVEYDDGEEYRLFIPTSMYMRAGAGMNLGFATKKARVGNETYPSKDSWTMLFGLGWNMSSYVRTELEFQRSIFRFNELADKKAYYNMINGMLYFDLARRYVQDGDITYRRTIVPFMGFGAGIGMYDFSGAGGASGLTVPVPRAELGINFMLTDMIGIDVYYQYQMLVERGFGWNTNKHTVDNISNVMLTFRMNF